MAISHSFRDTREFANLLAKSARGKMTEQDIARLIYVVAHWFVHGADAATSTSGPGTTREGTTGLSAAGLPTVVPEP